MAAPARKAKAKPATKAPKTPPEQLPAFKKVGRLVALGLSEPWQVALLLPQGYDDLRQPAAGAAALEGRGVLWLRPHGPVRTSFTRGVPRSTLEMLDATSNVLRATIFGDTETWVKRLATREPGWFLCEPNRFRDELQLRILEEVPDVWVGRLRPRYSGKAQYLPAERVRDVVHKWLPKALPLAGTWLRQRTESIVDMPRLLAAAGTPGWSVEQVLEQVHLPASSKMADAARGALRRIAAFMALSKAHDHVLNRPAARPLVLTSCAQRAAAFDFALTGEQKRALRTLATELAKPVAMRALLVGDTGTGKTAVFGTMVASAIADAGARAAILLPNLPLAEQVHREISQAWPDLDAHLVTGNQGDADLRPYRLLIGTTALLFREPGPLDLVVVDEEQKFSVEQREQLVATANGHLLTSSATCIPRSQALARYGAMTICELRKGHASKHIHTHLWQAGQKKALFARLRAVLAEGEQLLIVYPMKMPGESGQDKRHSVEHGQSSWEALAPGRVRALTSDDSDEAKSQVMADMREGRAQILLATTVVEVGVTLPGLRHMLVMCPDRYGLNTLHQLRGRLARHGGEGWFHLYAPEALSAKATTRLDAFQRCKDGFEVAALDLELRGFGDLGVGASQQSGADRDILFGEAPTAEDVAAMEGLWIALGQGNARTQRKSA